MREGQRKAPACSRGDEDEGSPPQGGANPGKGDGDREKIERSADALWASHSPSLPLQA